MSSGTGTSLQMAGSLGSLTSAGMLAFGAKGGAIAAAAGPVGWAALAVTAIGSFISSRKRRKQAKALAQQRQREIDELRRRAQENASLIVRQGERTRAASEMMAARGGITGESVLNQELAIVDAADRNAEKTIRETEFRIQGMQMEIENQKQLADEQYKADMINLVANTSTRALNLYRALPQEKSQQEKLEDWGKENVDMSFMKQSNARSLRSYGMTAGR
jgi:hypothetical protein